MIDYKVIQKYNDISNKYKRSIIEKGRKTGIYYNPSSKEIEITIDGETEEIARKNLLDKLSNFKYVKIINNKSGVKWIEVDTGWKIYKYSIHAFYHNIIIGKEEYKDVFGDSQEREILKTIVSATLHYNSSEFKKDEEFDLKQFEEYVTAEKELMTMLNNRNNK